MRPEAVMRKPPHVTCRSSFSLRSILALHSRPRPPRRPHLKIPRQSAARMDGGRAIHSRWTKVRPRQSAHSPSPIHPRLASGFFTSYNTFIKAVSTIELQKSTNKLPTKGTMKNARGAGPYFSDRAFMFAMAFGVAPIPKPQNAVVMAAAS